MKNTIYTRATVAVLGLSLLLPAFALAQTSGSAGVNASVTAPGASATISAAAITRAKTKADQEIDRRIKALNDLVARVGTMTKVSAEFKANLTTNVQTQVTGLANLKVKIDGESDGATIRTDVQSVTQAYRVFALVMPQARIAAAADREATIINMLAGIGAKLQARLTAAQQAGADATPLAPALADMGAKLTSAQTHAQAAINGSATLTPDNGDKDAMAKNTAALKAARDEVKAAEADIRAARKDVDTIVKGLKTLKVSATSSTTVQTQ